MSCLSQGNPLSWDWKLGPLAVCYRNAVFVPLRSAVITYYYPAVRVLTRMLYLFVIGATVAFERSKRIYAYHTRSITSVIAPSDMLDCTSGLKRVRHLVLSSARYSGEGCMHPRYEDVWSYKMSDLNG